MTARLGPPDRPIRILIVASVRFYREGLAQVLGRDRSFQVVAAVARPEEALEQVAVGPPQIVLLDLGVPDGPFLAGEVLRQAPDARLIAIAVSETEEHVIAWAEAGISGYVSRDASLSDLRATITTVAGGDALCTPKVAAALLRRVAQMATREPPSLPESRLTVREREVLALVSRGLSNKEIARSLAIALPTVKNHVHRIFEKLEVHGRVEAVSLIRWGASSFSA